MESKRNQRLGGVSQVKYGAIFAYLLIVVNACQGFLLAPYILSQIGTSSYGVYKTIASFSSALMVLDLGVGSTVMRYTAKFRGDKKMDEIGNFAAMGMVEAGILALLISIVSVCIYFFIPSFYAESFSKDEIALALRLFTVLAINTVLIIIENVLSGVIKGSNCFIFSNGTKLLLIIVRIIAVVALLKHWKSAVLLVLTTLICTVVTIILQTFYIYKKLNIRIRLRRWDASLFRESLVYTGLMFIQSMAIQANGNIDNIVISHVIGAAAVTVYSFGIQMFNMYESLATSFSNLMLPGISKRISEGASNAELQQTVTKVGRMQFLVLGAALAGFLCVGKDFIFLWLGKGFEDVYYLSLIMMVPVTFTLIQNVCLSILRAKNMMRFRTVCLIATACINAVITVIGTKMFNYYAAAVGTGLSVLLGSVIVMNIYYHKRIEFKVFRFYRDVFRRLLPCVLIPTIVVAALSIIKSTTWNWLAIRIIVFLLIYALLLIKYGLSESEKGYLFKKTRRAK